MSESGMHVNVYTKRDYIIDLDAGALPVMQWGSHDGKTFRMTPDKVIFTMFDDEMFPVAVLITGQSVSPKGEVTRSRREKRWLTPGLPDDVKQLLRRHLPEVEWP